MNRFKRPLTLVAITLVAALIASSCGSDSGNTTTTQPTTSTTTTDTTQPSCSPVPEPIPGQLDEVHTFISNTLIPDWQAARHDDVYTANRCWHDWTTDDCSAPVVGNTGVSFDFAHPCHRHDFGYRNYKRLDDETSEDTWNEVNKLTTDDQLLADAREHCSGRPWYLKNQCLGWAQAFYLAVRAFG